MEEMKQRAQLRAVNRKLTNAIKGTRGSLDRVEIPKYEWFYSDTTKEVYRYNEGVFEAHAPYTPQQALRPTNPTRFYKHHHLKVIPDDAVRAEVQVETEYIHLQTKHPPCDIWKEINEPKEVEHLIKQRNKRHLQQSAIEPGRVHDPIMQNLIERSESNDLIDAIRSGEISPEHATDEYIQAWLSALQQTATKTDEMNLPKIDGFISPEKFQAAFKAVKERTTSSPSGLHYTLWKVLAADLASWLSLLMSLPFMYGFAHQRWATMADVMLEKKKNVRKIHQLRIIGILEADFNTALKIIFGRELMTRAESVGLNNEQWGSRKNRTSTDAAMRKMMTFEYGRYMKATIGLFPNDQTACFDRMQPKLVAVHALLLG